MNGDKHLTRNLQGLCGAKEGRGNLFVYVLAKATCEVCIDIYHSDQRNKI